MRVSAANFSFGSKAKMSQIAPNIFQTFYQISSRLSLTFQHIKNLDDTFFILASYHPFWLLSWSKIKNLDQNHKSQNDYLWKIFHSCYIKKSQFFELLTVSKVKMGDNLPKWKHFHGFIFKNRIFSKIFPKIWCGQVHMSTYVPSLQLWRIAHCKNALKYND